MPTRGGRLCDGGERSCGIRQLEHVGALSVSFPCQPPHCSRIVKQPLRGVPAIRASRAHGGSSSYTISSPDGCARGSTCKHRCVYHESDRQRQLQLQEATFHVRLGLFTGRCTPAEQKTVVLCRSRSLDTGLRTTGDSRAIAAVGGGRLVGNVGTWVRLTVVAHGGRSRSSYLPPS